MGNNICQCKIICQNLKEADLSSEQISFKNVYYSNDNQKNNNNKIQNSHFLTKKKKRIETIYIINCIKKIERAYLKHKENLNKNKKNANVNYRLPSKTEKEEKNKNIDLKNVENDNFTNNSIYYPFYIDKVHKTKTIYKKFSIPKINNGKSLEFLLKKNSIHSK